MHFFLSKQILNYGRCFSQQTFPILEGLTIFTSKKCFTPAFLYAMVKRVTENAPLKYNFVVGAGKHVMNDIENRPTLKTKTKENLFCFLLFVFSPLKDFKNKLVCEFSQVSDIIADTVVCLIIIHIAIKSLATTIFLTSMMPIIVL